jgi:hypothetical protein
MLDLPGSGQEQVQIILNKVMCLQVLYDVGYFETSWGTIQINHQPDATIFQFIILTFIYSSTCFGCSPACHQELNDYSNSLWFYLCSVAIAVLCLWLGWLARTRTQHGWPAGPTTNTARLSPWYKGKTRGCYCSHWAPDDGWENAQNMLSCK